MAQGIGNQITKSFTSRSLVQICPCLVVTKSCSQLMAFQWPLCRALAIHIPCLLKIAPRLCLGSLHADPLSWEWTTCSHVEGLGWFISQKIILISQRSGGSWICAATGALGFNPASRRGHHHFPLALPPKKLLPAYFRIGLVSLSLRCHSNLLP